jgi:hypothetical protein
MIGMFVLKSLKRNMHIANFKYKVHVPKSMCKNFISKVTFQVSSTKSLQGMFMELVFIY